ncbi:DUF362 domain-containing protein [Desulfomonile tiedjei]|uniref:Uncharacterized Fe-S center protein n=1 Tax=Desulfomonile tiedjei (strain ATCC 49306 / DSM 6799 / DCB-1) TaxID=706587 RepID=I4C896_DESTA|nr:DUF362 domain-containing protein [Desulfomonile tiedjei]AFM25787.1 uncharacterized Fe-S center protein [Desulfomonile tiedjei DSM 6799]
MPSTVYFTDLTASWKKSVPAKVTELFEMLDPSHIFQTKELIAVKLHFGESGNTAHIRPQYVRKVIDRLKELGTKPFLTDTNTLYVGSRTEAYSHLVTAFENGFNREVTGAPAIIADGLRGNNQVVVRADGHHFQEYHIAADICHADGLVVLTHFKGHELSSFGGAIKNIGMGCASREGKLSQHSNISPKVAPKKCIGCEECVDWCRGGAISIRREGPQKKAFINPESCVGCAECILTCAQGAIQVQWNESIPVFMEKMVEYAAAVLKEKRDKSVFVTFITDVSPLCDCTPFSDRPIVPGLGILASRDPVAIDQAAVDLINAAPGNPISNLQGAFQPGEDKFKSLFPDIEWSHQLEYAEQMGLGTRDYEMKTVG